MSRIIYSALFFINKNKKLFNKAIELKSLVVNELKAIKKNMEYIYV